MSFASRHLINDEAARFQAQLRRRWKRESKIRYPDLSDEGEVKDLKKRLLRKRSSDRKNKEDGQVGDFENGCLVCGDEYHYECQCPWLDKVPPNRTVGPHYDIACIRCGQIGEVCCSKRGYKAGYAVLKLCGSCHQSGHWAWECPTGPKILEELIEEVPSSEPTLKNKEEDEVMVEDVKDDMDEDEDDDDDEDSYDEEDEEDGDQAMDEVARFQAQLRRKWKRQTMIRYPDLSDEAEVEDLRKRLLRKRSSDRKNKEDWQVGDFENGCLVCGDEYHYECQCPWLDKVPPNRTVGPQYDIVCVRCGQIGEVCCSKRGYKAGYAVLKLCGSCHQSGHWAWECPTGPKILEELIEEVPSSEPTLKSKEVDEVMVEDVKDDDDDEDSDDEDGDQESGLSRSNVVKALKTRSRDIVSAIKELTT